MAANEIRNVINLLDESRRLKINYTCRTTMLKLVFELTDYELTAEDATRLYIRSPSGYMTYIDGTKNLSDNSITFQVAASTFAEAGGSMGQIRITKQEERLYSTQIRLNIHPYYGGDN